MKKKIYTFITLSLIILAIAPAVNIRNILISDKALPASFSKWKAELYNMDFALPYFGMAYYTLGISFSPEQVIIGKGGWLFLGDEFVSTVTDRRNGATEKDAPLIKKAVESTGAWNDWFLRRGVDSYQVLIGPDKGAIYSEKLPEWAAPAEKSITEAIVDLGNHNIVIYPKSELLSAKSNPSFDLYYKTDTHWNNLGAWVAFDALAERLRQASPDLLFPSRPDDSELKPGSRGGGDLAKFLRIRDYLKDSEVLIEPPSIKALSTVQYDFASMKQLRSGNNSPVGTPESPLLVASDGALNKKKVLWLRDSFGSAMSTLMAATFSETLQVHHVKVTPKIVADLVEKFKPDIVIVTIVERNTRSGFLVSAPPSAM